MFYMDWERGPRATSLFCPVDFPALSVRRPHVDITTGVPHLVKVVFQEKGIKGAARPMSDKSARGRLGRASWHLLAKSPIKKGHRADV